MRCDCVCAYVHAWAIVGDANEMVQGYINAYIVFYCTVYVIWHKTHANLHVHVYV